MPARIKLSAIAGPACSAAACPVNTKMPAPITAPTPSVTRLTGPSDRLSVCSPSSLASSLSAEIGLTANKFGISKCVILPGENQFLISIHYSSAAARPHDKYRNPKQDNHQSGPCELRLVAQ